MSMRLNRAGYQKLVDENIEWLEKQPRTLEREHVIAIVRESVEIHYPPQCQHPDARIISTFDHQWGGCMVMWCPDCGAHNIHDEYDHCKDDRTLTPEKWEWVLPKGET